MSSQNALAAGAAGTLIAIDPSAANAGGTINLGAGTTYAIQMAECATCTRHSQTINTMLTVMQQQAQTLKDQQATIASLIAMHGSNGTKPSILNSVLKGTGSRFASAFKTSGRAASVSKRKKEDDCENGDESMSNQGLDGTMSDTQVQEHIEEEDITATKIWLRGTLQASEKCPCPLPECAGRKFAASDMYYLRRHFQQVHRLTHPNPLFVVQCPINECDGEFPSVRDMRKHIQKDHRDIWDAMQPLRASPSKRRKSADLDDETYTQTMNITFTTALTDAEHAENVEAVSELQAGQEEEEQETAVEEQ